MTNQRPKRRWYQFSLRALLLLMLLASLALSWLGVRIEQKKSQHRAVAAIEKLGGEVALKKQKWSPAWLESWLGDHFFETAIRVTIRNEQVTDAPVSHSSRSFPT